MWQTAIGWVLSGVLSGALTLSGVVYAQRRLDHTRDHEHRREVYEEFLEAIRPVRALAETLTKASNSREAGALEIAIQNARMPGSRGPVERALQRCRSIQVRVETISLDPGLALTAEMVIYEGDDLRQTVQDYPKSVELEYVAYVAEALSGLIRACARDMRDELGLPDLPEPLDRRRMPFVNSASRWRPRVWKARPGGHPARSATEPEEHPGTATSADE